MVSARGTAGACRGRWGDAGRLLAVLGVVGALAACEPADGGGEAGEAPRADAPAAVTDSNTTSPIASRTLVALDGEGLRLVDATTGSTRPIAFGSEEVRVREVLEATLAGSPVESGDAADCGLQYARWEPGLTTWFADGRFVGWAVRGEGGELTTMTGVGLGSSRAELESAHVIEVAPSSLGIEFSAGGLAGLLEGEGADSRITHLWAGSTCIAR